MTAYKGRIDSLAHIINFLKVQKEQYVILTDTNIAATFDLTAFIDAHIASGADVTVAYTVEELPAPARASIPLANGVPREGLPPPQYRC